MILMPVHPATGPNARTPAPRRGFLKLTAVGAAAAAAPLGTVSARSLDRRRRSAVPNRRIQLFNRHTQELVDIQYCRNGHYDRGALQQIDFLMRDHRRNEVVQMDVDLIDLLHDIRAQLGTRRPLELISAYRSPQTNAMLRRRSQNVARKSFHLQGRAADIHLPGVSLGELHHIAIKQQCGGVGLYTGSCFVHVDTGPVRRWGS